MLVLNLLIIVGFVAGSSYGHMSIECYTLTELECQEHDFSEERPKTAEDLLNICTALIPDGHCVLGVMEKCAENEDMIYDTEENVKEFRKTMDFIESNCNEDSPVFKAIAGNLPCVTSTLENMDDICEWGGLNDTTREKLLNLEDTVGNGRCIYDSWIFYCLSARMDVECGNDVRDAFSEILLNLDYVHSNCINDNNPFSHFEEAFNSQFRLGKKGESAVRGIMEEIAKKID